MTDLFNPSDTVAGRPDPRKRAALFAAWLVVAGYFVATHVMWRDEVRAFTLALGGADTIAMLRAIHGEGHPATWYLLLRAAHTIVPVREVLPAVAALLGAGAAAMLAFRAPFRGRIIALALFGEWMVFEYTAVARNYGISALLLFLFADRHDPRRTRGGRGWQAGALLFLLCNANVPSVLLAAGLLLFWLVELIAVDGWRRTPALGAWAVAAGCAGAGALLCFATVYPPYQDAAVSPHLREIGVASVLLASVQVVDYLFNLLPMFLWQWQPATDMLLVVLVAAILLSLARTPAGFVAMLATLLALLLFFHFVYPGAYRHVALLFPFILSLHWMVARGGGGRWPQGIAWPTARIAAPASALLALLLAIQVGYAGVQLQYQASGGAYGRAAELGRLLHRPDLTRAIVMSNPDVMVEPLGYYAPNPTWLLRQRKFGRVVRFTFFAERDLSLADMLATARQLRERTGRPVVMLLRRPLDPAAPTRTEPDGPGLTFSTTPAQVVEFLAATTRLARLAPTQTDENYDVYLLR
jgi:hypothetical protein